MMNGGRKATKGLILVFAAIAVAVATESVALAAGEAPVKEIVSGYFGWKIDATTGGNVCTVASEDQCRFAAQSGEPGGFRFALGVAVNNAPSQVSPEHGDVYVADL